MRGAYDAFNRGGAEGILTFLDPEVEWNEAELPARRSGIYRGHAGVRRLMKENAALWDDIEVEVDDVIEAGEDRVVAFIRAKGRGRNTGVGVELAGAQVWTLRDGKGLSVRFHLEREAALEAVGLR